MLQGYEVVQYRQVKVENPVSYALEDAVLLRFPDRPMPFQLVFFVMLVSKREAFSVHIICLEEENDLVHGKNGMRAKTKLRLGQRGNHWTIFH